MEKYEEKLKRVNVNLFTETRKEGKKAVGCGRKGKCYRKFMAVVSTWNKKRDTKLTRLTIRRKVEESA